MPWAPFPLILLYWIYSHDFHSPCNSFSYQSRPCSITKFFPTDQAQKSLQRQPIQPRLIVDCVHLLCSTRSNPFGEFIWISPQSCGTKTRICMSSCVVFTVIMLNSCASYSTRVWYPIRFNPIQIYLYWSTCHPVSSGQSGKCYHAYEGCHLRVSITLGFSVLLSDDMCKYWHHSPSLSYSLSLSYRSVPLIFLLFFLIQSLFSAHLTSLEAQLQLYIRQNVYPTLPPPQPPAFPLGPDPIYRCHSDAPVQRRCHRPYSHTRLQPLLLSYDYRHEHRGPLHPHPPQWHASPSRVARVSGFQFALYQPHHQACAAWFHPERWLFKFNEQLGDVISWPICAQHYIEPLATTRIWWPGGTIRLLCHSELWCHRNAVYGIEGWTTRWVNFSSSSVTHSRLWLSSPRSLSLYPWNAPLDRLRKEKTKAQKNKFCKR